MKNYFKILIPYCGLLLCISCNKYLDVQPQDKLTESQVFSSEAGINTLLNNIYVSMASDALYGGNLTLSSVEVLGQQFRAYLSYDLKEDYGQLAAYNYVSPAVMDLMDAIWKAQYKNIIDANNLIVNLDVHKGILTVPQEKIIKGEAYGLRAMAHFDLLRLFGPVYVNDPSLVSIPYYTKPTTTPQPIIPASDVILRVLADLQKAAELLSDDPIITLGKQEALLNDGKDFYRFRNLRMNYYAVKALEARVQLYAGNKPEALVAAKEVIAASAGLFPWTDPSEVNAVTNPDCIFSSEIIFAIQNPDLYSQQKSYFTAGYGPTGVIRNGFAPTPIHLDEVYEDFRDNDYRFRSAWLKTSSQVYPLRFVKYEDVDDKNKLLRLMQPLIRISEMYYIAAEAEEDPTTGLGYLNTVRNNRGLIDLDPSADLEWEVTKEYQKEFYGEGQLFFYYKRKNMDAIPDGADEYGGGSIYDPGYVVPLPQSETIYR